MSRAIRVELLKVTTTRLSSGLLATGTGLTVLLAVLRAATAGNGNTQPLSTAAGQRQVLTVLGFALLIATVFGATLSSGEFRHRTATVTYLAFPHRSHVLIAKVVAAAGIGLLFGALGFAATTAVTMIFIATTGDHLAVAASTIIADGAGMTLAAGLLAAVGVALGTLIRAQLAVVIGTFIWIIFGESILGGVVNQIEPYLAFTAATTLGGAKLGGNGFGFGATPMSTPLPFIAAVALILAIGAALALVAAQTILRSDIA
jgi:ABC-2 type transport system permease protein